MRRRYREKEYRCGDYLEVDVFPVLCDVKCAKGRKKRYKPTSAMQERLNQRNAERELTRILNRNFGRGDISVTLTYRADTLPKTEEEAMDEEEDVVEIAEEELLGTEEKPVERTPKATRRAAPSRRHKPVKGKKQPDYFLWVAITAGVIALLAIAFGIYNETTNVAEEEPMEMYEPLIETAAQSDPYGELNE